MIKQSLLLLLLLLLIAISTTISSSYSYWSSSPEDGRQQGTITAADLRLKSLMTFRDTTVDIRKSEFDDNVKECEDEVSVDFALSRTLSTPFSTNSDLKGMNRGHLYLRVALTAVTGDALQQGSMRLILEDARLSSSGQKSGAFFQKTVVALIPPSLIHDDNDDDHDNDRHATVTFDVKVPLTAHATIDTLPHLLRFRIEKYEQDKNRSSSSISDGGGGGGLFDTLLRLLGFRNEQKKKKQNSSTRAASSSSSRIFKPVSVTYGHDTVVLSTDLFRTYFNNTYFDHLQRVSAREFNVLFFGVMGSGKSTQMNTIISALGDRVHRIAEAGGGSRHHTQKFVQYRLHDIIDGLGDIRINLYDTWGLGDGRWKASTLFQSIVKGELPLGHTMHKKLTRKVAKATQHDKSHHRRKIHSVLLFLSVNSAFDNEIVRQIRNTMDAAMRNDINPIVVVTMAQDKSDLELTTVKRQMQDMFRCPVFMNDVYLDHMTEKVFSVDQNALSLLEMALRAASDHLHKQHAALNTTREDTHSHEEPIFPSVLLGLVIFMAIVSLVSAMLQKTKSTKSTNKKGGSENDGTSQQKVQHLDQEFPVYQNEINGEQQKLPLE